MEVAEVIVILVVVLTEKGVGKKGANVLVVVVGSTVSIVLEVIVDTYKYS